MKWLTGIFSWIDELGELWITKKRLSRKNYLIPVSCGASYFQQAVTDFQRIDSYPASREPGGQAATDVPVCPALSEYREKLRNLVRELEKKFETNTLTWDEFYSFQSLLLPIYPEGELRGKHASLRDQFYISAPQHLITMYEKSAPPALGPATSYAAVLCDALFLQHELAKIETYRPHQELKRNTITFELYVSLIVVLGCEFVVGLFIWFIRAWVRDIPLGAAAFPFVVIVMMLGALGAAVSSQRRLQQSFDQDGSLLNSTRYVGSGVGVKLAPFQGSVFAAVLLFILYSGLANTFFDGVLPDLRQASPTTAMATTAVSTGSAQTKAVQVDAASPDSSPANSASPIASPSEKQPTALVSAPSTTQTPNSLSVPSAGTPASIATASPLVSKAISPKPGSPIAKTPATRSGILTRAMLFMFGPNDTVEYAKILVYAFLAGFAERLVPDTLDRLTSSKK